MKTVTVVLNGFKRQGTLPAQIARLKSQSYPVEKIMYFNLKSKEPQYTPDYPFLEKEGVEYADTSHDYGVWGRFTFALNATTDFVCIMDDDIIPGEKYIENCVKSFEDTPGIYGTMGNRFDFKSGKLINYGWKDINNEKATQVNYLYQTWFMPREALHAFWGELRPESLTRKRRCGEDMNISLMAYKKFGLKSYVVPHPIEDPALWGNTSGDEFGEDEHAIHLDSEIRKSMHGYLRFAVSQGMAIPGAWPVSLLNSLKHVLPSFLLNSLRRRIANTI